VTGVGGGVIRDILLARVPLVLRADIYATAAFFGALVVVVGRRAGLPPGWAAFVGGVACFALRMMAVVFGWHLPQAAGWQAGDTRHAVRRSPQCTPARRSTKRRT
jgi:uncharacterized membrane protein YeiH